MFKAAKAFTRAVRGSNQLAPEVVGDLEKTFPTFEFKVKRALGYIPPELQTFLQQSGIQIIATPSVLKLYAERPDLKTEGVFDFVLAISSQGIYHKGHKTVILPQYYRATQQGYDLPVKDVTHTLLHETGHAIKELHEALTGDILSEDPDFIAAFDRDVKRLREDPEIFNLVQNWHAVFDMDSDNETHIKINHEEIFAELFYELLTGRRSLALCFKSTFAQMPVLLERVAALQPAPDSSPNAAPNPQPEE